jgi:hypothetical protein
VPLTTELVKQIIEIMSRSFILISAIVILSQVVTAFNILEAGKSSVFRIFQHAKADDDWNWDDRPRRDQKSLLIVFDTTGSMDSDLVEMKTGAQDIVNNFAKRSDQPIFNYVLSLFNDPGKFEKAEFSLKIRKIFNIEKKLTIMIVLTFKNKKLHLRS